MEYMESCNVLVSLLGRLDVRRFPTLHLKSDIAQSDFVEEDLDEDSMQCDPLRTHE